VAARQPRDLLHQGHSSHGRRHDLPRTAFNRPRWRALVCGRSVVLLLLFVVLIAYSLARSFYHQVNHSVEHPKCPTSSKVVRAQVSNCSYIFKPISDTETEVTYIVAFDPMVRTRCCRCCCTRALSPSHLFHMADSFVVCYLHPKQGSIPKWLVNRNTSKVAERVSQVIIKAESLAK